MAKAAKKTGRRPVRTQKPAPARPVLVRDDETSPHFRPSRANKKPLTVYVDPTAAKAMRYLALEEDSSVQALLVEAVDAVLKSRGRKERADPD